MNYVTVVRSRLLRQFCHACWHYFRRFCHARSRFFKCSSWFHVDVPSFEMTIALFVEMPLFLWFHSMEYFESQATNKQILLLFWYNVLLCVRYGLTGTPLQNKLQEFWCVLDWANPGSLGSSKKFNKEFGKPIRKGQPYDATKRELAVGRKSKWNIALPSVKKIQTL